MIQNVFSAHGGWVIPETSFEQTRKAIALSFDRSVQEGSLRANALLNGFREGAAFQQAAETDKIPSEAFPQIMKLAFMEFCVSERGLKLVGAIDNLPAHPSQTERRWKSEDNAYLGLAVAREIIKGRNGTLEDIFKSASLDEVASLLGDHEHIKNLDGSELTIDLNEKVIRLDCRSEIGREPLEAWSIMKTLDFCLSAIPWDRSPNAGGGISTVESIQVDAVADLHCSFKVAYGNTIALELHDQNIAFEADRANEMEMEAAPSP